MFQKFDQFLANSKNIHRKYQNKFRIWLPKRILVILGQIQTQIPQLLLKI